MWGWLGRHAGKIAIICGVVAVGAACLFFAPAALGVVATHLATGLAAAGAKTIAASVTVATVKTIVGATAVVAAVASAGSGGRWLGYREGDSNGRAVQQQEIERLKREVVELQRTATGVVAQADVRVQQGQVQDNRVIDGVQAGINEIKEQLKTHSENQGQDKIAMEGRLDDLESRITAKVVNELVARGFIANAGKQAAGVANMPPARGSQQRRSQRDVAANDAAASSPAQASLVP